MTERNGTDIDTELLFNKQTFHKLPLSSARELRFPVSWHLALQEHFTNAWPFLLTDLQQQT
jgi:hypothetical protein